MNYKTILKLGASLAIPLSFGAIAGAVTTPAIAGWYEHLNSPTFKPPNSVFGPVWTTLYVLMGISLFMVWMLPPGNDRNKAMGAFAVQLTLNFVWSFLFFYFKVIGYALVDIALLWVSIIYMLVLFYRIKRYAAYMNIPYLLWVSFAAVLNLSYYLLN